MSYTPNDELLDPSIRDIRESFGRFHRAVEARNQARDWSYEHLEQLAEIRKEMFALELRLAALGRSTS